MSTESVTPATAERPSSPPTMIVVAMLASLAIAIFAIRLTGLPDLVDNEYRLGATVLSVVQGGDWIIPHNSLGDSDKPPMLTWLSAFVSLATGHVDRFSLYLPTAIATLALALIAFATARRYFGGRAGLFAGLVYLLSNVAAQQMATARWDGLFALTVALVALAAFHAWTSGRGWTLFWLAAVATTLTKGPLGILLGSLGLFAVLWERRSGTPLRLRGSHAIGLALFLVLVGGWFAAAYYARGPRLVDNMIRGELVHHAVMGMPGHRFRKPPSDFVANFAPWSLVALLGLWRIWSSPSTDDTARRFERFCFCWFVGGLLLFALSPHNPARLLFPIMPPAAIIAGRELDRLTGRVAMHTVARVSAAVALVALVAMVVKYHHLDRKRGHIQRTRAVLDLHDVVHARVGDDFPLTYAVDAPFAVQLTFETMRPAVTFEQAAALLDGDVPAYVVVHDDARLRDAVGAQPIYEVAAASMKGQPYLRILSNRSRLEWDDPIAMAMGPLQLRLSGVHVADTQDGEIALTRRSDAANLTVINADASDPVTVTLRASDRRRPWRETRSVPAGESWLVNVRD